MSRFLGKRFTTQDGIKQGLDSSTPAIFFENDTVKTNRSLNINDSTTIAKVISATGVFSMGATLGVIGSLNFSTSIDVPLTGAAIGDVITAIPTASVGYDLIMSGVVLTANYVRMVGAWTGTTGAHGAVNLSVRLVAQRF